MLVLALRSVEEAINRSAEAVREDGVAQHVHEYRNHLRRTASYRSVSEHALGSNQTVRVSARGTQANGEHLPSQKMGIDQPHTESDDQEPRSNGRVLGVSSGHPEQALRPPRRALIASSMRGEWPAPAPG